MTTTIDEHSVTVTVGGMDLLPQSMKFTLDQSWSPYGQATIECPIPDDLDTIDPRLNLRVAIRVEQAYGAGVPISTYDDDDELGGSIAAWTAAYGGSIPAINAAHFQAFNSFGLRDSTTRRGSLSLRQRKIDWVRRTAVLTLATDEALLQAYKLVATSIFEPTATSVRVLAAYVLNIIGAILETGTDDGTIDPAASQWIPGTSAWDYLAPLVQATGLRLFCDELRRWYLIADDTVADGQLTLSDTKSLTDDTDEIDLDGDWYDAVVVTYTWVNELGVTQQTWDTASEDGFSKVFNIEYNLPYPGAGAAGRVLARALGRGRTQDVRAISNYTAVPGQAVSITVDGDETQVGYVSSVSWEWPAAEMTVKSRGLVEAPPTAWALDPAGVSWADLAVGIDWTEDI